jgi:hypothetical protein
LESNNPAWARESRPGPAGTVHRSSPAGIPQSGPAGIKIWRPGGKSRPGRILLIRPSRGKGQRAQPGRGPAGMLAWPEVGGERPSRGGSPGPAGRWRWPSRGCAADRPTRGRGGAAQPGRERQRPTRARRPGREAAHPGRGGAYRPRRVREPRPSRGKRSGPAGGDKPAQPGCKLVYTGPAINTLAWASYMPAWAVVIRLGDLYSGPELLFACFSISCIYNIAIQSYISL